MHVCLLCQRRPAEVRRAIDADCEIVDDGSGQARIFTESLDELGPANSVPADDLGDLWKGVGESRDVVPSERPRGAR